MAISMSALPMICDADSPVFLRSYVAVANEAHARKLERYFKSGSGKAFAMKRLLEKRNPADSKPQTLQTGARQKQQ